MCRGHLELCASHDEVEQRYGRLPRALAAALLPFQREGVRFGLARRGRILLADEMGVGKTMQAIALASCYQVRADRTAAWSLPDAVRQSCGLELACADGGLPS
jgi:SNF2 family DNA or RNA helicase